MWNAETIASLTTAAGTLVLGVATFGATRSANRSSRIAERSLLTAMRPVLMPAQIGDPMQKIGFSDEHWVRLEGPGASAELDPETGVIYLAMALRNVGSGIGVIQGWYPTPRRILGDREHPPVEEFRPQSRDLYVPPGGIGFWQGAFRDPDDPLLEEFGKVVTARETLTVDLLYTDLYGRQQTITRFSVIPFPRHDDDDEVKWLGAASRHWVLDGDGPR